MPSPRPPSHLSPAGAKLYRSIRERYLLEPFHVAILCKALEAMDRADAARRVIEAEGLTIVSRLGATLAHPCVTIERDSRTAFLAGIKALHLDLDGPPPPSARR